MAGRHIGNHILLLLSIFFMIFMAPIVVSAQSPVVVSLSLSPGPSNEYTGWPLNIGGTIFDGDRRPVSGAVVKLWQNGQLVHNGYRSVNVSNPVISRYYSPEINDFGGVDLGGFYSFSGLYPGIYEITVEKESYNTSVVFDANASNALNHGMISLDIWLDNYHGPVWTQEQLSSKGAITGVVYDTSGQIARKPLITLEQNGQIMNIPYNPRYAYNNGTYVFKYLLPGQYQVVAEVNGNSSLPANVTVNNGTVSANLKIQDLYVQPTTEPAWITPVGSVTPHPSPSFGILTTLTSLILILVYMGRTGLKR